LAEPCAQRNPLSRSGMTREGRRRAELATDYFIPDERDLADLILFGQRFAKHVQYYNAKNQKAGDWSAFFESDITASLAALAKLPVVQFRTFQADLERWLKAVPKRDVAQLSAHAKLVFHLPLALIEIVGGHHARLPSGNQFGASIVQLVERELSDPLAGLAKWYKGAIAVPGAGNPIFADTPLIEAEYNLSGAPGDARVRVPSTIARSVFGRPAFSAALVPDAILSKITPGTWAGFYAAQPSDSSPYVDAIGAANQRYEQIYDALSYNLMTAAVERIYQGIERIRRDAVGHLTSSLDAVADHTPHYGLWLAFLRLFEHAKREINTFTARHLDFYFREVLQLSGRPATPDKAHLLFELAKGQASHLLTAGTLFRAGKDATGKPLSYALENDIVVNRATVAELRGLQVGASGTAAAPSPTPRAALVVPSRDGIGEVALAKDDPTWPPFGPAASPAARIGFAIADRKLFLREGTRIIQIRADLTGDISPIGITPRWRVRLTGKKGWFEPTREQIATKIDNNFVEPAPETEDEDPAARKKRKAEARAADSGKATGKRESPFDDFRNDKTEKPKRPPASKPRSILEVTVTLDPEDPPIVPLDAKLHGAEHAPGVPVVEVAFDFTASTTARAFAVLRNIRARRVTLRAEAAGLKNLMIVAGGAVADPAKPFAPFGAQPHKNATFIVGSSEIFSKSIDAWRLNIDWQAPYSATGFFWNRLPERYDPHESVLAGGRWRQLDSFGASDKYIDRHSRKAEPGTDIHLGETNAIVELGSGGLIDGLAAQTPDNPSLDSTSVSGFLRVTLPRDFGHADFIRENTRALVGLAGGTAYQATSGVNLDAAGMPRAPYDPMITRLEAAYETKREEVDSFTLLHPFGTSAGGSDGRLFPNLPFEGALLIGIADFAAPARLTLLVQVADGSGDPLKQAPDLEFAFLDGNAWVALEPQNVDDKTMNFAASGVLGLNIPEAADTDHSVMPAGLHWVRIAAKKDADALNRLLLVAAQAARATFVDSGNDPAFLETPLPAGTISKLVTPDLAIKKISQPYNSFGGRPRETPDAFATRVSERLRHKDRAVTMFDYEALVLEAFPGLYRVKCLNTTELKRDQQNVITADNELSPGAVTVVTVPWTHGANARDPLRPYTDQATLAAVDQFLRPRLSPFVRLEVQNPKLEEVHVDFKVKFMPEIGDIAFYIDELNKAIVGFLTPWAQPGGGEITFGGRLWKSSIIDFIEEQPHIDFITDFRLYHKVDIAAVAGQWSPIDVEVIEATTARSILVSAASHAIHEVQGDA
jgi:hypothetical protein